MPLLLISSNASDMVAEGLDAPVQLYCADLSDMEAVDKLASELLAQQQRIDVLINNAGVFKTPSPETADNLDVRFVVNTIAPYHLTHRLLPVIPHDGRVVNLSSAAQAPVDLSALQGPVSLDDFSAYAQSKLAITIWSSELARQLPDGPVIVAVNPGSLLASKMVKEGFGVGGNDLSIGAEILVKAALSEEFENASGMYFDNDAGRFSDPHPDAKDSAKNGMIVEAVEKVISKLV